MNTGKMKISFVGQLHKSGIYKASDFPNSEWTMSFEVIDINSMHKPDRKEHPECSQ